MSAPLSIIGIMVDERDKIAPEVQEIITKHGRDIIGRMGVPSPSKDKGLITLVYEGEPDQALNFQNQLQALPGVDVRMVSFPQ